MFESRACPSQSKYQISSLPPITTHYLHLLKHANDELGHFELLFYQSKFHTCGLLCLYVELHAPYIMHEPVLFLSVVRVSEMGKDPVYPY